MNVQILLVIATICSSHKEHQKACQKEHIECIKSKLSVFKDIIDEETALTDCMEQ